MKKKMIITLAIIFIIVAILIFGGIIYYQKSLEAVSSNSQNISVKIEKGMVASQIATTLKEKGLINSDFAFKIYVKINKISGMQAGTYTLNKNMSVQEIVKQLQSGTENKEETINITFLEGKNMRWIAKKIAENTNNTENAVFEKLKDESYLTSAINKYWFITNDIKNDNIYYSLEGYLFPDTYNFLNKDVTVETIFNTMLDQMESKLSKYKTQILNSNLSVHKLLTVASIAEMEAANEEDRSGVAGVIYNRIKNNMSIGSDVTTYYAIKVDMSERDLYQSELNKYNQYNTRGPNMQGKLPVGPISTVGLESIDAAINPENNNYLFFVADKNGKIYFAKTNDEHDKIIANLKSKGLWYTYEQ